MAKLIALSTINHNGKIYGEGEELEISDKAQVVALETAGVAVAVKAKKSAATVDSSVE